MSKIKVFCFPYAGGSSVVFNQWKRFALPEIEMRPVELAGRGIRINEPLYADMTTLIDDVFHLLKEEIRNSQYALFGHSMGAMVAFQLAKKIAGSGLNNPMHIFFSGHRAPHIKKAREEMYHLLGDSDFEKKIIDLGGTPPEYFQHPEFVELFLPVLKNDFRLVETYSPLESELQPFENDITVFFGKDDDLEPTECHSWSGYSSGICNMHYFNGGHFFLNNEVVRVIQYINKALVGKTHYIQEPVAVNN